MENGTKYLLEKNIRKAEKSAKIAIYGTGNATEEAWPIIEKCQIVEKIKYVLDRNTSRRIGTLFHGIKVTALDSALQDADVGLIMICSDLYWGEIQDRIGSQVAKSNKRLIAIYDFKDKEQDEFSIADYREYINYLEKRRINKRDDFVPFYSNSFIENANDTKLVAWYLPQYYPMDINDKYHGKGFTEWTNSSQVVPMFVGHDQPHIPYDVGFYDLRIKENMQRQVELARHYGIYGFCFHWYWFSGKRTMEKPVEMFLENKDLDIHFCIHWATENWTSSWDGGTKDIIFEQKLQLDDIKRLFADLLPYFQDKRYIRIENKPVFIIYSVDMFSDAEIKKIISDLQILAREAGFSGLYLLVTNHDEKDIDMGKYGFQGLVEFPPSEMGGRMEHLVPKGYLNSNFRGHILDYAEYVDAEKYFIKHATPNVFRSVLTSFDNSARWSVDKAVIFYGACPKKYKKWLKSVLIENKLNKYKEEDFVFLNSWNEWAEGSHLEPDIRKGYAYLEATKNALYEVRDINSNYIDEKVKSARENKKEVKFVIECVESLGDIVACEPIPRYLKDRFGTCQITWIIKEQYEDIIKYNPYIDEVITVTSLEKADLTCNSLEEKQYIRIDLHYNGRRGTNWIHVNEVNPGINEFTYFNFGSLLEAFSLISGLPKVNMEPKFYLKGKLYYGKHNRRRAVIHCKSAEKIKDWQEGKWTKLIDELIENGYEVCEIGLESYLEIKDDYYKNLTDEHNIQKIASIIKSADIFIGVDSGFAHIANCFHIPSLILMGQYKNFERPQPYTGYFKDKIDETILYAKTGGVKELPLNVVLENLKSRKLL